MMIVLVTGSSGFIGRNLIAGLGLRSDVRVLPFDLENIPQELDAALTQADLVFHLAGVNRPQTEGEFKTGNVDLTEQICNRLLSLNRPTSIVLSSSIQAALDNPYGRSKREAEHVIERYAEQSGIPCVIYRFKNVFGKWSRPNYNSVVATFCYNIARDLPISISDESHELELIYIDDVVRHLIGEMDAWRDMLQVGGSWPSSVAGRAVYHEVTPAYKTTLGHLAGLIRSFRDMRQTLVVPDLGDAFTHKLYGTYLSFLDPGDLAYGLKQRSDPRGCLAEFVKAASFGQIFVSRTKPGITRGDHYHHTKTEKFLVLEGEAIIRFRHIQSSEVLEYRVRGTDLTVVDIPTGYTHSIENVGTGELITLFWASEVFDPERTDTYAQRVLTE
jgi:UDP-2-acetamido-2,6-beta-L-arabino-hexul-4-ose reductase